MSKKVNKSLHMQANSNICSSGASFTILTNGKSKVFSVKFYCPSKYLFYIVDERVIDWKVALNNLN